MPFNRWSNIGWIDNSNGLIRECHDVAMAILTNIQCYCLATVQNLSAMLPAMRFNRLRLMFLELLVDPFKITFGKCLGFLN